MAAGLPTYFRYSLWANLRLLDTCAPLSDTQLDASTAGPSGSLRAALVRLLTHEEGFVGTLKGQALAPCLADLTLFPGFEALRLCAVRSGEELVVVAEQRETSHTLLFEGPTHDGWEMSVLIQAITHTTLGRSELETLLRRQKIEPPAIDGWSYALAIRKRDAERRGS